MQDRAKQGARLMAIRLRYSINTHLEDQGLAIPVAIGTASGLPAAKAVRLLTRRQ
jgi:hypothetical protein